MIVKLPLNLEQLLELGLIHRGHDVLVDSRDRRGVEAVRLQSRFDLLKVQRHLADAGCPLVLAMPCSS
jgi:hypothetical protein